MKKYLSTLLIILCCIGLTSCNRKQAALDNFEAFIQEISADSSNYSLEEWEDAEIQYEELVDELDQYEYSPAERRKIRRLKAQYAAECAKRTAHEIKGFFEQAQDVINQFQR
ncbi:MAG: hypothetical protein K2H98_00035 [Duncaniella sp.]|nr:hypothetical protein [Duncaniella sp.]